MTTQIRPTAYPGVDPLYPPKDEPRPDGMQQEIVITQQLHVFRHYFRERSDVVMSSDNWIYYERGNPRAQIAPDWYISFGVDPQAVISRDSYLLWEVGKPPEFVLEIASKSTWRNDLTHKRDVYASLGIAEYWRFDPTPDTEFYPTPLAGERLVDGVYQSIAVGAGADGVISGYSTALDVIICWDNRTFRLRDPRTGADVLRYEEEKAAREQTTAELDDARVELDDARAERDAIAAENQRLRERLRRLETDNPEQGSE